MHDAPQRTCSQRLARLPTVTSCAGWKWVNPSAGSALCLAAKAASAAMSCTRRSLSSRSPSRIWIMSVLSQT